MKKITYTIAIALASLTLAFKTDHTNTISVNTELSSIEWTGKKVTGEHTGNIKIKSGSLIMDHGLLSSGSFVIDMTSITCTDLKGGSADKLVGHLKSKDFFDVENHTTATFKIESANFIEPKENNGNNYQITGKLTIKGIESELSFPAKVEVKDGAVAAYAIAEVDRTKHDIKYGSASFIDGIGDKAIDDNFTLKIKIAAK